MEKFSLHHTALYAKGWYKRFQNHPNSPRKTIWDDLRKTLSSDDYMGEVMSKKDIVFVILNHCQTLKIPVFTDPRIYLTGISEEESWKYGYVTKNSPSFVKRDNEEYPEWDYWESILYYLLSNLRLTGREYLGWDDENRIKPDFKSCLPIKNGIKLKTYNRIFNQDVAN